MFSANKQKTEIFTFSHTAECFNLDLTLDCGQAFRWQKISDGEWHGVAGGRALTVAQRGNETIFSCPGESDFDAFWYDYFDLGTDYVSICNRLCTDPHLSTAVTECNGIRILRQEPWEALCSFIISQNNNIPRIKGIVSRLCETLGEPLGNGDYAFPTPQSIEAAGIAALKPLRAGFRDKYIFDAACKVASGEVDLQKCLELPLDEAEKELIKIKGVGAKVAQCTLLYGLGKKNAFPVDVWVRRVMAELYPDGLPECTAGAEGIAQQYLFHWRRTQSDI